MWRVSLGRLIFSAAAGYLVDDSFDCVYWSLLPLYVIVLGFYQFVFNHLAFLVSGLELLVLSSVLLDLLNRYLYFHLAAPALPHYSSYQLHPTPQ